MGKHKKIKSGDKVAKPQPLADQIINEKETVSHERSKWKIKTSKNDDEYVDGSLGQTIMKQSLAQLKELRHELDEEEYPPLGAQIERKRPKEKLATPPVRTGEKKTFIKLNKRKLEEEDSDTESIDENLDALPLNVEQIVKNFEDDLDLDKEDFNILEHFNAPTQRRLADLFRDKITEKQTEIQTEIDAQSVLGVELDPIVLEECHTAAKILSKYRSGKLPKMFKSFSAMSCWEQLLNETEPDKWTAAAMYQATRIFVSNLKASMAQRFCNLILLPRIRDDISYYKRLNYHLYQALVKTLYKPAAFFKGIILPLCSDASCTLREAIIIGSVLSNKSIPAANSAAAILNILEMDYQGSNYIFLRVLFDKKYGLPYQVVDECVEHFSRFVASKETLPVLWHQALLSFVQRYKNDMTLDQKELLQELVKVHSHYKVTPRVQRELQMSTERKESMVVD